MTLFAIAVAIGAIAFLYSSVGHAGASGYIAVMTLFAFSPADIKPTALLLNILVASIGTVQFWRAGYFSWRLFWPFVTLSVPLAFVGGYLHLPSAVFKTVLGIVLLLSAVRLIWRQAEPTNVSQPPISAALGVGAGIGLLSGLTGTGGGIFLTPLLLFGGWATTKRAAAVSAPFLLMNSISGLTGYLSSGSPLPSFAIPLALVAVICGTLGSYLGARRFPVPVVQRSLAAVLLIAGSKLVLAW